MKKKAKSSLVERVTERLQKLGELAASENGPVIGIEDQKNLEKALESYLQATTHLAGAKKEYEIAQAHHDLAAKELRLVNRHVKKLFKGKKTGKKK